MTTPFFIECPIKSITYLRNDKVENKAINLSMCTSIKKSRLHWYPDNSGIPSIKFFYNENDYNEWAFGWHQEKDRDAIYELIVNNKFDELKEM